MIDIVKIFTIYLILLYTCYLFGVTVFKITRFQGDVGVAIVTGFFALFGLFQIVALPYIILKKSLSDLTMAWILIFTILVLVFSRWSRREFWKTLKGCRKRSLWNGILLAVVILLIAMEIIMQIGHNYWGWDTAYYIGTVNTSLYTDTMYLYDGTTGLLEEKLHLRYALSSFYMLIASFCKVFSLHPIICFRYIVGVGCILLSNIVAFEIGKKLFPEEGEKQKAFLIAYIILNFLWVSNYSNAEFLLKRGYESKGYCANVIIPIIFYLGLLLLKSKKEERARIWLVAFVVGFASVPVSMSALVIVPMMFCILAATCLLLDRDWKSVGMGLVCTLPNIVYGIVYLLYVKDILIIGV